MKSKKKIKKKTSANYILGENLRLQRKRAGMNLIELAKKLNISPQQLQKYETGENRISAEKLFIASQILKVSLGSFYSNFTPINVKKRNYSDILLENFDRINSEKIRKHLLESCNIFAELGV